MAQFSSMCGVCLTPSSYEKPLVWCRGCALEYCDNCWENAVPFLHKSENPATAANHEKTEIELAKLIESILNPTTDKEQQATLHENSQVSKWFGVMNEEGSSKHDFHDFGCFPRLAGGSDMDPDEIFPCLVSFIGDTGAGKSSVINALLKVLWPFSLISDALAYKCLAPEIC